MKRHLALAGIGLTALSCAGLAVAKGIDSNKTATAVSATFSAAPVAGRVDSKTCTTTDGKSVTTTRETLTGSATGSTPDLTGAVTIDANSVINTTNNIGIVSGHMKIAATGGKTDLHFTGVYDAGNLAGLAPGTRRRTASRSSATCPAASHGHGLRRRQQARRRNLRRLCRRARAGPLYAEQARAREQRGAGHSTAVSTSSITVAGLQCVVPASLVATVGTFHLNDRAHIRCTLVAGVSTLVKIDPPHDH